jgi:hypothetical protein
MACFLTAGGVAGRGIMARILMVVGALGAVMLFGGWTFDRQGPFCIFDREYTNCGYPSYAACVEAARGVGGYCRPNPQFSPDRQARGHRYR